MQPIDEPSRVELIEQALLTLAKQVKALEKEVYNLKYKGQCE